MTFAAIDEAALRALRAPAPSGSKDVVVTVPQDRWPSWIAEGDLPGDPPEESGEWDFYMSGALPRDVVYGSRVYVVAHGMLRGYAPLLHVGSRAFVRGGGAVGCTLRQGDEIERIPGFRGWRYAAFPRERLHPFPSWATEGVPARQRAIVELVLAERAKGPVQRARLQDRALAGAPLFEGVFLRGLTTTPTVSG